MVVHVVHEANKEDNNGEGRLSLRAQIHDSYLRGLPSQGQKGFGGQVGSELIQRGKPPLRLRCRRRRQYYSATHKAMRQRPIKRPSSLITETNIKPPVTELIAACRRSFRAIRPRSGGAVFGLWCMVCSFVGLSYGSKTGVASTASGVRQAAFDK